MRDKQRALFDKFARDPIPPKEERETPKTHWDRGAHSINSHFTWSDLALQIWRRNETSDVPRDGLEAFVSKVDEAQQRSREEALDLLRQAAKDPSLHPTLKKSVASMLGHFTRRANEGKRTPAFVMVTRDNIAEAIAEVLKRNLDRSAHRSFHL